jgi:hypothetical protein
LSFSTNHTARLKGDLDQIVGVQVGELNSVGSSVSLTIKTDCASHLPIPPWVEATIHDRSPASLFLTLVTVTASADDGGELAGLIDE